MSAVKGSEKRLWELVSRMMDTILPAPAPTVFSDRKVVRYKRPNSRIMDLHIPEKVRPSGKPFSILRQSKDLGVHWQVVMPAGDYSSRDEDHSTNWLRARTRHLLYSYIEDYQQEITRLGEKTVAELGDRSAANRVMIKIAECANALGEAQEVYEEFGKEIPERERAKLLVLLRPTFKEASSKDLSNNRREYLDEVANELLDEA